VNQLYFWFCVAVSIRVADDVSAGNSLLGAAVRVRLQSPERARVLVEAAPAGVHHAESVHLVGDLAAHVREIGPAVAAGIAGVHVN